MIRIQEISASWTKDIAEEAQSFNFVLENSEPKE